MPSSSASSRNVFMNMLNENKYQVDILCFTKVVMLSFFYVLFFFFFLINSLSEDWQESFGCAIQSSPCIYHTLRYQG